MTFTHLDEVLDEVKPLGQLFAQAGYRLFLVGGIVRDQWLDEPLDTSSDIDLTTNALPAEIKRIVSSLADDLWTQGERFGTIGLRSAGRDYEITTHRAESYSSGSRKPTVSFGDDIGVDLSRRDFTVNAMAIELPGGELVDPFGGATDLPARRLRTPLSADISFTDDPLRMLRAARFATKYALVPEDELTASATTLHERLRIVAIERIGVELRRLLGLESARVGLAFLAETGLLAEVVSYGEPALIEQVQPRMAHAIKVADELPPDWHQRLAGIAVTLFGTAEGVYALCERLRLSKDNERRIVRMSRSALQVIERTDADDEMVRRWLDSCEDRAVALGLAAVLAKDPNNVASFEQAVQALLAREGSADPTFLDGGVIMALLDVGPGPMIGAAQKFLRDGYFANGPLTPAAQQTMLLTWWAGQPSAN
jgi:poly(A) polymerase